MYPATPLFCCSSLSRLRTSCSLVIQFLYVLALLRARRSPPKALPPFSFLHSCQMSLFCLFLFFLLSPAKHIPPSDDLSVPYCHLSRISSLFRYPRFDIFSSFASRVSGLFAFYTFSRASPSPHDPPALTIFTSLYSLRSSRARPLSFCASQLYMHKSLLLNLRWMRACARARWPGVLKILPIHPLKAPSCLLSTF